MQRIKYQSSDTALNEQIIALLCECFGTQFRDYYLLQLAHLPTPQHTKLLTDERKQLISFTQVVDYTLRTTPHEPPYKVAYLYSVCTTKREQGKGIMTHFLNEILSELKQDGYAATFLMPAETWLVDFYNKFGFVWQKGGIYEKVPRDTLPLIAPEQSAKDYLQAVAQYEKRGEGQQMYEQRKQIPWVPLMPPPLGWMLRSLQMTVALPEEISLLQPLT